MITSGCCRRANMRPSRAVSAVCTVRALSRNARRKAARMEGSSSTTSKVGIRLLQALLLPPCDHEPRRWDRSHGQREREQCAAVRSILSADRAAVSVDQAFADAQTQPKPCFFAAHERLEQSRADTWGDPRSAIADLNFNFRA